MPIALRKVMDRAAPIIAPEIRCAATGPVIGGAYEPYGPETCGAVDVDVMVDPLHPMHRDLLARVSGSGVIAEGLTQPQRLAVAFYGAISAWGFVWLMFQAFVRIV